MALKLPRLPIITAIVDLGQRPTPYYQKLWALLCSTLEANDVSNAALLAQINAAVAQLQTVALVANTASVTASQANSTANPGSPQRQASSSIATVSSSTFTTVVSINFPSAIAVTSVDLDGTGPQGGPPGISTGQVQVRRNGTVIAGPVSYSTNGSGVLTFSGFTPPGGDTTTGSVTYDLQVKKTGGVNLSMSFLLDVTRTP